MPNLIRHRFFGGHLGIAAVEGLQYIIDPLIQLDEI